MNATDDMYELEEGLDPWGRWRKVKDDANMIGPRSPMIPGLLAGICEVLSSHGSMELRDLFRPAIGFARGGIPVDGYHALHVLSNFSRLLRFPETAKVFIPDGIPPRPGHLHQSGSLLVQTDLARSLELIAQQGPEVFYRGELAQRIDSYLSSVGGILSADDLASYQPRFEGPERISSYRNTTQVRTDGYFVPLILNILENFDLSALSPDDPGYVHLQIEATRYAFVALLEYLADPQVKLSPIEGLWSKSYAAEIAGRIDPRRACEAIEPVDPWPFETRITGQKRPAHDMHLPSRGNYNPGTTQVIAVDKQGNVGTFNLTHSGAFGSMVTVPGTGILLNGAMTSMDPEPGRANSIHPKRRQMGFSAPALILRNGRPFFAFSGSGGRSIISCQTQVICGMVDHKLEAQQAIEKPRTHSETRDVMVDSHFENRVIDDLRRRGHRIRVVEETFYAPFFARPVVIESVSEGEALFRSGLSQHHRVAGIAV